MTNTCFRLDDYLDGRLSDADAEAFETHTLACPACDAALDEAAPDLSALRDVACPPEVVEAALRTARRAPAVAPDRSPAVGRSRRRFAFVPLALAAALAVAVGIGVTLDRGADGPPQPIAEAVTPADVPETSATEVPPAEPAPPASNTTAEPEPVATPRPTPAPPPLPAPAPAPEPIARPSDDFVAQADPAPDTTEPEPTPEEIEAAREDLALAFHLVAEAQTQARQAVRAEATPLTHTIDRALPF